MLMSRRLNLHLARVRNRSHIFLITIGTLSGLPHSTDLLMEASRMHRGASTGRRGLERRDVLAGNMVLLRGGPGGTKACARAPSPKSRALETDAS
jgi:hypothetical protein